MNNNLDAVLKKQMMLVKPSTVSKKPQEFIKELNELLKKTEIQAEAVIGGSWAKGTYLPNDHDIDIFVKFDKKYSDIEMSNLLEKSLKTFGTLTRIKGSRDYFQLQKNGFVFELVPVLNISNPKFARNVTDMSPMHVDYVLQHIAKNPSLVDNIRLIKKFCKSANVYGAESYINGFSGHVLDLLIIHYGSFTKLLNAAVNVWAQRLVLPVSADISSLSSSKTIGPMVILDPVQPNRNAAAALSKYCFDKFKEVAKNFLKNPTEDFFVIKPLTKSSLQKKYPKNLFTYELTANIGSKDVVGTKLLKVHEYFIKIAKKEGFVIINEGFYFNGKTAICYFVTEKDELESTFERLGPPISQKTDVSRFRNVHKNHQVLEKKNHLVAIMPRLHTTLKSLFLDLKKTDFFHSRSQSAKII